MPFVLRAEELSVIPYPSVLEQGEGNCSISADTKLVLDHQLKDQEVFYSEYLASVLGFPLRPNGKADSKIQLSLQPKANIPQEGYRMLVTESGLILRHQMLEACFMDFRLLLSYYERMPQR